MGRSAGARPGASPGRGSLAPEVVQTVIQAGTDALASCYEGALAQDGALEGKVVLRWTVAPDGAVRDASVVQADYHHHQSSRAVQAELESCAVKVVASLRFPPPTGGGEVEVRYPFLFSSHTR
jgi:TonB family protein